MPSTVIMTRQFGYYPLFELAKNTIFFDVGANEGGYVETFLHNAAERVYAFEPGPKLCEKIANRFPGNEKVIIEQVAVSDKVGELKGVTWVAAWTLAKPAETKYDQSPDACNVEGYETVDIPTITLDAYLDSHPEINNLGLLKIDVDGYEYFVLKGAEETINRFRPYVYIEISMYIADTEDSSVTAFLDQVEKLNYQWVTADGRPCSKQVVLREWPWHSSCDMILIPQERVEELHSTFQPEVF